jgi:phosphoglycerate kinase
MDKKTVRDIELAGKRVFLRTDFNVPLDDKTGKILDDSRIQASVPTIQYLINHQAKVILCSHIDRPKGVYNPKMSLNHVVTRLSGILGIPIAFTRDCVGREVETAVSLMKNGDVLLLENVRFHIEEENDDPNFSKALARLADVYVDDAFGTAHRSHASMVGITKYLPSVAGLLLEKELNTLGGLLKHPAHPFGTLLGGAKVSDKVALMQNIMDKVVFLLVGGGMAATFLKAQGYEIGESLYEPDRLDVAQSLIKKVDGNGVRLILPVDAIVTDDISDKGAYQVVDIARIPKDKKIVDIGPLTIDKFSKELQKCQTVFWNGPMGIYEIPQFSHGTNSIAWILAGIDAATIIGGGSTAEIVINMGLGGKMSFVSTGGGASMSFLSGEKLPAVEALLDK